MTHRRPIQYMAWKTSFTALPPRAVSGRAGTLGRAGFRGRRAGRAWIRAPLARTGHLREVADGRCVDVTAFHRRHGEGDRAHLLPVEDGLAPALEVAADG